MVQAAGGPVRRSTAPPSDVTTHAAHGSTSVVGMQPVMRLRRLTRAGLAGLLLVLTPIAGACSDEDGDGATTDEEISDVDKEVDEEIDGQNEGSNEDGE